MEGFIIVDYLCEFPRARAQLTEWLEAGKIKTKDTILKGGLEVAEQGLVDLFKGINTGKSLYIYLGVEVEVRI
jgi:NADPH-dependent curcumin reductase CurA